MNVFFSNNRSLPPENKEMFQRNSRLKYFKGELPISLLS